MSKNTKHTPDNSVEFHVDEEFGLTETTAILDNGDFGTRTVRFETGQLARQADGSVTTYLDDDTMLLATTTASNPVSYTHLTLPTIYSV